MAGPLERSATVSVFHRVPLYFARGVRSRWAGVCMSQHFDNLFGPRLVSFWKLPISVVLIRHFKLKLKSNYP